MSVTFPFSSLSYSEAKLSEEIHRLEAQYKEDWGRSIFYPFFELVEKVDGHHLNYVVETWMEGNIATELGDPY